MNWKERALNAAQKHAENDAIRQQHEEAAEVERQRVAFEAALQELLGEPMDVDGLEVVCDGVTFSWQQEFRDQPQICIKGRCDICGHEVWSNSIDTLVQLGNLLEHFSPGRHECIPKPTNHVQITQ